MDARTLTERIRMRRKKLKEEGVENMVATEPAPQMNPQDIWNDEKMAQHEETIPGADEIGSGPDLPTMDRPQQDDSQNLDVLKRHMEKIRKILGRMSMSN